jgi:hypothetical protein
LLQFQLGAGGFFGAFGGHSAAFCTGSRVAKECGCFSGRKRGC